MIHNNKELQVIDIDKLKNAVNKDFNALYKKEFTTDWKAQRIIRSMEIKVMAFENLEKYINGLVVI